MHFDFTDIREMPKIQRLNLINSITGIKPGNLIGTKSNDGQSNLAVISSIVHLGSNPPLLGFILRPQIDVRRHTYENILSTGVYTINHIHEDFIAQAHYTSAKFPANVSEFKTCGLTEEYHNACYAPFVKESPVQIGMKYLESMKIEANNTVMVVGQIEHIHIDEHALSKENYVNLETLKSVGIGGLNSYYRLSKIGEFPYARPHETPDFTNEKK